MLGTVEKLAGAKLLQLPAETLFSKGPVKLLDTLNVNDKVVQSQI